MSLMATTCPGAKPQAHISVRRPLSRATQALTRRPGTPALGAVRTKDSLLDAVGWKQR